MRVLVTGGAGFIGSRVCETLVQRNIEVRTVDCFLADSNSALEKKATWKGVAAMRGVEAVVHDLRAGIPESLLDGVDVVVNEAAMPGLMRSWSDFELYAQCNLHVVDGLARACTDRNVHLVQVSTSSVYGHEAVGDESAPTEPTSPYGVTKLAAEELLRAYHRSFGLPFTILRYFSVYGPRQRPDMAYRLIIDAVAGGREVVIHGDGLQTRSNTFVGDCADATVEAALRRPIAETINIAGPERTTLLDAVRHIEEALGRTAQLVHREARPGDQRHTGGHTAKARELLGWEPTTGLQEGLRAQVVWQAGAGVTP
jgi:nucleoside-diphosphate-sugar epimerase